MFDGFYDCGALWVNLLFRRLQRLPVFYSILRNGRVVIHEKECNRKFHPSQKIVVCCAEYRCRRQEPVLDGSARWRFGRLCSSAAYRLAASGADGVAHTGRRPFETAGCYRGGMAGRWAGSKLSRFFDAAASDACCFGDSQRKASAGKHISHSVSYFRRIQAKQIHRNCSKTTRRSSRTAC